MKTEFNWRKYIGIFFVSVFWICVILVLVTIFDVPLDDTDNQKTGERSGMRLLTDHRTGCQYLGGFLGSVTPRLDGKGNHIGCWDAKEEN